VREEHPELTDGRYRLADGSEGRSGWQRLSGATGLLVVDKEAGPTSHDVVARARRRLGTKKVGHSGTLDPGATGVLLLGVGSVTRLLKLLTPLPKSSGARSSSAPRPRPSTTRARSPPARHGRRDARRGAERRCVADRGDPAGAADGVGDQGGGPPAARAAREGIEVERAARPVTVHRFEVEREVGPGVVAVAVDCSSGTYVRTLAADLGAALGGGAHLRALRRTAVGPFDASGAAPVDEAALLPPVDAVAFLGPGGGRRRRGRAGATRPAPGAQRPGGHLRGAGPWAIVEAATGDLLAVYRSSAEQAVPDVVLPA
jgi:tRNA pseudouridine55 synthase